MHCRPHCYEPRSDTAVLVHARSILQEAILGPRAESTVPETLPCSRSHSRLSLGRPRCCGASTSPGGPRLPRAQAAPASGAPAFGLPRHGGAGPRGPGRAVRLPVQAGAGGRRERGQDVRGAALQDRHLLGAPGQHHRRGLHHEDAGDPGPAGQAADLGHGWSGALPHHHAELLPQRQRGHPGLRHHQEELLPVGAALDRGRAQVRGLQHRAAAHREQVGPRAAAGGASGRGAGPGGALRHPVCHRDVGQGLKQCGGGLREGGHRAGRAARRPAAQREGRRPHPAGQQGRRGELGLWLLTGRPRGGLVTVPRPGCATAAPASTREEAGGAQRPEPGLWALAGAWEHRPSSALPGLARLTPEAAVGCGFPGAQPGPRVLPGPPRASCAATGPLLPSLPALTRHRPAPPQQALPLPFPPGPVGAVTHRTRPLAWGPELLHSGCQSSDSFSPGSQQVGRSRHEMGGWTFQERVEGTPSHPPCRDACCHSQSASTPHPCQSSLDKGYGPGCPGSGPTALVAFSWG